MALPSLPVHVVLHQIMSQSVIIILGVPWKPLCFTVCLLGNGVLVFAPDFPLLFSSAYPLSTPLVAAEK